MQSFPNLTRPLSLLSRCQHTPNPNPPAPPPLTSAPPTQPARWSPCATKSRTSGLPSLSPQKQQQRLLRQRSIVRPPPAAEEQSRRPLLRSSPPFCFFHRFMGHGMLAPVTAAGWQSNDVHPLVIERFEGSYVYDINGNKYLDSLAGLWCSALVIVGSKKGNSHRGGGGD